MRWWQIVLMSVGVFSLVFVGALAAILAGSYYIGSWFIDR